MKLRILVVVTVFCVVYLDCSCATPASLVNPSSLGKTQSFKVKASNGSVIIQHTRVRRQSCSYREHWSHRCRSDCECGRGRYCSSYGFCHDRTRERRQYGYNIANEED